LNLEDKHAIEKETPGRGGVRIYDVTWEIQDKEDLVGSLTIVIPSGHEFVNVIGEMAGAMPLTE
jgi:hypothetical protein